MRLKPIVRYVDLRDLTKEYKLVTNRTDLVDENEIWEGGVYKTPKFHK